MAESARRKLVLDDEIISCGTCLSWLAHDKPWAGEKWSECTNYENQQSTNPFEYFWVEK